VREAENRVSLARLVEGAAIGVALWCILYAFQLLPGIAADTPGVLLFTLAGGATGVTRLRPALIATLVFAAAIVVVVTQTRLANLAASRWIREDPLPDSALSAVVVLSAGVNPNNTLNGEGLDHLLTGLELVRAGAARVLVTTTVEEMFPRGSVSSGADQARIVALFGGSPHWMRTPVAESTRDEAVKSAETLLPRGLRRIAVVAAPMHTRRACSAFEAVGFDVTCVPARTRTPGGNDPGPWPADRLRIAGEWAYEVVANAEYSARGWLRSGSAERANARR
jgi:uncharacterized SAM-binding protein YcdF (DUF218 family)